jgi:hypothetical protein
VALTHLVDTSVIGRLGEATVRAVIEPLTEAGRVGRAGITDLGHPDPVRDPGSGNPDKRAGGRRHEHSRPGTLRIILAAICTTTGIVSFAQSGGIFVDWW